MEATHPRSLVLYGIRASRPMRANPRGTSINEIGEHWNSNNVSLIFAAGSDPEVGPAALLPAGRPAGPDDGTEETQAEDGIAQLCAQSDQHRGPTLKQ